MRAFFLIFLIFYGTAKADVHSELIMLGRLKLFDDFKALSKVIEGGTPELAYGFASSAFQDTISREKFIQSLQSCECIKIELIQYFPIYEGNSMSADVGDLKCFVIFREYICEQNHSGEVVRKSTTFYYYMAWEFDQSIQQWRFITFPFSFAFLPENMKYHGFSDINFPIEEPVDNLVHDYLNDMFKDLEIEEGVERRK